MGQTRPVRPRAAAKDRKSFGPLAAPDQPQNAAVRARVQKLTEHMPKTRAKGMKMRGPTSRPPTVPDNWRCPLSILRKGGSGARKGTYGIGDDIRGITVGLGLRNRGKGRRSSCADACKGTKAEDGELEVFAPCWPVLQASTRC